MTSKVAKDAFRKAIEIFFPASKVELGIMPHYGGELYTKNHAFLVNGYFYNFHTQVDLTEITKRGLCNETVIIPSVREIEYDKIIGFEKVATHTESIVSFENSNDVFSSLSHVLNRQEFRELRRKHRKINASFEVVSADQLNDTIFDDIIYIDALHNIKYKAKVHLFNRNVQTCFINSPLSKHLRWILRRDERGVIVQFMMILLGLKEKTIYCLHQAINHKDIAPGDNFYVGTFVDVYLWGKENGFDFIHLGRGGANEKKKIGASLFYTQNHWLKVGCL
ncbi:hypothetical protein QCD58_004928 [Enterobacter hormaechei]|nr:hypothetical protein [Enterobacter hormaechei]